jgi:serine/threonine protein phosphatase 1
MPNMTVEKDFFANIEAGRRIWAIAPPEGDAERLRQLHKKISRDFCVGDVVVYLGNLMGKKGSGCRTIDEALLFRRAIISIPGTTPNDIVFLRGGQEEMFHKVMQIQFSQKPEQVYRWMLDNGLRETLLSYDIDPEEGFHVFSSGAVSIARWVAQLRQKQSAHDGHLAYMSALKHAARTVDNGLLFVHRGINHDVPLAMQGDSFWWGGTLPFDRPVPYAPFAKVVRSCPSVQNKGVIGSSAYLTLLTSPQKDGTLFAVLFDKNHRQESVLEV